MLLIALDRSKRKVAPFSLLRCVLDLLRDRSKDVDKSRCIRSLDVDLFACRPNIERCNCPRDRRFCRLGFTRPGLLSCRRCSESCPDEKKKQSYPKKPHRSPFLLKAVRKSYHNERGRSEFRGLKARKSWLQGFA